MDGYIVGLSSCGGCGSFTIIGVRGTEAPPKQMPGQRVRTIQLDRNRVGYLVVAQAKNIGVYFEWRIGSNTYTIRLDPVLSDATYAAIARSVVLVPKPVPQPPQPPQNVGFYGSCYAFRGAEWSFAQTTSSLITSWWTTLQRDYNGNYPPPPLGGSIRGITTGQFQAAKADMQRFFHTLVGQDAGDGPGRYIGISTLLGRVGQVRIVYGLNSRGGGPYHWAADQLGRTVTELAEASRNETVQAGSGLDLYHQAQQQMSYAWQALRQLPCQAHPYTARPGTRLQTSRVARVSQRQSLSVQAWVSPNSMPYNAYPTLYARTTPGASCTADVIYDGTNRHPVSFNGYAQVASTGGTVAWRWHEETKGGGGTGYVTCALNGITVSTTTTFTVG